MAAGGFGSPYSVNITLPSTPVAETSILLLPEPAHVPRVSNECAIPLESVTVDTARPLELTAERLPLFSEILYTTVAPATGASSLAVTETTSGAVSMEPAGPLWLFPDTIFITFRGVLS